MDRILKMMRQSSYVNYWFDFYWMWIDASHVNLLERKTSKGLQKSIRIIGSSNCGTSIQRKRKILRFCPSIGLRLKGFHFIVNVRISCVNLRGYVYLCFLAPSEQKSNKKKSRAIFFCLVVNWWALSLFRKTPGGNRKTYGYRCHNTIKFYSINTKKKKKSWILTKSGLAFNRQRILWVIRVVHFP